MPDTTPETQGQACGHCWHFTGRVLASLPPQDVDVCCWCGVERSRPRATVTFTEVHGPHEPRAVLYNHP